MKVVIVNGLLKRENEMKRMIDLVERELDKNEIYFERVNLYDIDMPIYEGDTNIEIDQLFNNIFSSDAVIFTTSVHMGNVSTYFKNFIDYVEIDKYKNIMKNKMVFPMILCKGKEYLGAYNYILKVINDLELLEVNKINLSLPDIMNDAYVESSMKYIQMRVTDLVSALFPNRAARTINNDKLNHMLENQNKPSDKKDLALQLDTAELEIKNIANMVNDKLLAKEIASSNKEENKIEVKPLVKVEPKVEAKVETKKEIKNEIKKQNEENEKLKAIVNEEVKSVKTSKIEKEPTKEETISIIASKYKSKIEEIMQETLGDEDSFDEMINSTKQEVEMFEKKIKDEFDEEVEEEINTKYNDYEELNINEEIDDSFADSLKMEILGANGERFDNEVANDEIVIEEVEKIETEIYAETITQDNNDSFEQVGNEEVKIEEKTVEENIAEEKHNDEEEKVVIKTMDNKADERPLDINYMKVKVDPKLTAEERAREYIRNSVMAREEKIAEKEAAEKAAQMANVANKVENTSTKTEEVKSVQSTLNVENEKSIKIESEKKIEKYIPPVVTRQGADNNTATLQTEKVETTEEVESINGTEIIENSHVTDNSNIANESMNIAVGQDLVDYGQEEKNPLIQGMNIPSPISIENVIEEKPIEISKYQFGQFANAHEVIPYEEQILVDQIVDVKEEKKEDTLKDTTKNLEYLFKAPDNEKLNVMMQVNVTGDEAMNVYINIENNKCSIFEGINVNSDLTVDVASDKWKKILAGETTLQKAFMTGMIKVIGNFVMLSKLDKTLFAYNNK